MPTEGVYSLDYTFKENMRKTFFTYLTIYLYLQVIDSVQVIFNDVPKLLQYLANCKMFALTQASIMLAVINRA